MIESLDDKEKEKTPKGRLTVKAVVKRADGTIEDLGIISEGSISMTPESSR